MPKEGVGQAGTAMAEDELLQEALLMAQVRINRISNRPIPS